MKKKFLSMFLMVAATGLVFVGPASALLLSYTDTTTKDGFDIEYALAISVGDTNDYDAVFTITSSSTSTDNWYAGAFNFKFFNGEVPTDLYGPLSWSGSTGSWTVADQDDNSDASIGGWSSLVNGGRAGFYLTDLYDNLTYTNATEGVLVSAPNTASFTFSFSGQGVLGEYLPFQVAYWGEEKKNGGLYFGQLSQTLSVPEPATALSLGIGLLGLAVVGRKRIFKK